MGYSLPEVDLIRERLGVGYADAKDALDKTAGDVVAALALLEGQQAEARRDLESAITRLIGEVRQVLAGQHIAGVRVTLGNHTLSETHTTVGGWGAVLLTLVSTLLRLLRLEIIVGQGPSAASEATAGAAEPQNLSDA